MFSNSHIHCKPYWSSAYEQVLYSYQPIEHPKGLENNLHRILLLLCMDHVCVAFFLLICNLVILFFLIIFYSITSNYVPTHM